MAATSEGGNLAKLIILLGIITLIASALYPVNGPGNAFTNFQNQLSVGLVFPSFVNPYAVETRAAHLFACDQFSGAVACRVTNNGGAGSPPSSVGGSNPGACTITLYWLCARTQDAGASFVRFTSTTSPLMQFNLSADIGDLTGVTVTGAIGRFQCRSTGSNDAALKDQTFVYGGGSAPPRIRCPVGSAFTNVSVDYCPIQCGRYSTTDNLNGRANGMFWDSCYGQFNETTVALCSGTTSVDVSFVAFDIFYNRGDGTSDCNSGGGFFTNPTGFIGCAIQNFVVTVAKLGLFIVNGVVFILVSLALLLIFIGLAIGNLLFGFINAVSWFFKIPTNDSAPCTSPGGVNCIPLNVQLFVSALFAAAVGFTIYLMLRIVRGSGPA